MAIRKLLLADADDAVRAALESVDSWHTFQAVEPAEALAICEAERPDVVLVCANHDGALCQLLQGKRATARIPVLLLGTGAGQLPRAGDPDSFGLRLRSLFEAVKLDGAVARLHELGGVTFVREMIDLFLSHGPTRLEAARRGEQAGDWPAVEQAAHSLKSSAANLGAVSVQDLCDRIESLAMSGRGPETSPLIAPLEEAFAAAKDGLQAKRDALP